MVDGARTEVSIVGESANGPVAPRDAEEYPKKREANM